MSQQLLAFRLAKPVEPTKVEAAAVYDPQTQTTMWFGGSRPMAIKCTWNSVLPCPCACWGHTGCNAYGSYCTTWNAGCGWHTFKCD